MDKNHKNAPRRCLMCSLKCLNISTRIEFRTLIAFIKHVKVLKPLLYLIPHDFICFSFYRFKYAFSHKFLWATVADPTKWVTTNETLIFHRTPFDRKVGQMLKTRPTIYTIVKDKRHTPNALTTKELKCDEYLCNCMRIWIANVTFAILSFCVAAIRLL